MNAHFLSRRVLMRVQAISTVALIGSFSACTNIKNDSQRTRTEGEALGAAVGDSVGEKKEGYAQQESALDGQFDLLNRKIARLKSDNAKLRDFAAAREQQLASVLASDRSEGLTVGEFDLRTSVNSEIGKADRAARSWKETIDAHKAVLKGASADARGPELEAEINRLSEERAELLRQRARLISINEKLAK